MLDFPNTPADGEEFSFDGTTWVYQGDTGSWKVKSQVTDGGGAPAPPAPVYDGVGTYGWNGTWGGWWASLTPQDWDPAPPVVYDAEISYFRFRQVNQSANFIMANNKQPTGPDGLVDTLWIDTFVFEDMGMSPTQCWWNNNNQYLVNISHLLIPVMPDYDQQRGFFRVYDQNPGITR